MAEKQENRIKLKREFKTKNKKKQQGLFSIIHHTNHKSKRGATADRGQLKKVKESAEIRQPKGNVNEKLDEICDNSPKEFQKDVHGIHHWCYEILPTQPPSVLSNSVENNSMKYSSVSDYAKYSSFSMSFPGFF